MVKNPDGIISIAAYICNIEKPSKKLGDAIFEVQRFHGKVLFDLAPNLPSKRRNITSFDDDFEIYADEALLKDQQRLIREYNIYRKSRFIRLSKI